MSNIKQVEWFDDYDLLKSFLSKKIKIWNKSHFLYVTLPTIKNLLEEDFLTIVFNVFRQSLNDLVKGFEFWEPKSYFQFFQLIYFKLDDVQEFIGMRRKFENFINFIFKDDVIKIDKKQELFYINDCKLDEILWNYVWDILWLSFGDKRSKKQYFGLDNKTKQALTKAEDRIKAIRARGEQITKDNDKTIQQNQTLVYFTVILNTFQQIDLDFLFNCTNAQINWFYDYAHRIENYKVETQIFAAGNSKSKKLKFFTEK